MRLSEKLDVVRQGMLMNCGWCKFRRDCSLAYARNKEIRLIGSVMNPNEEMCKAAITMKQAVLKLKEYEGEENETEHENGILQKTNQM